MNENELKCWYVIEVGILGNGSERWRTGAREGERRNRVKKKASGQKIIFVCSMIMFISVCDVIIYDALC